MNLKSNPEIEPLNKILFHKAYGRSKIIYNLKNIIEAIRCNQHYICTSPRLEANKELNDVIITLLNRGYIKLDWKSQPDYFIYVATYKLESLLEEELSLNFKTEERIIKDVYIQD